MQPLKDIYTNQEILRQLAKDMQSVYPALDEKKFNCELLKDLEKLELKARIERVADVCNHFLPEKYSQTLDILYQFVEGKENKLIYLFLPTFVAKYGQQDYPRSIKAIEDFTQYSSSEEGVRTFLEQDVGRTLKHMLEWTRSKNAHVRRLASEGCRPRLPWAKKISVLIQSPQLTWPILEALKKDPEKYVQKSVANHVNDISKDHADWIVNKVREWDLSNPATQWIIKHGMRSLVKQGHKGALALFGYHQSPKVCLKNVKWDKRVHLGKVFQFSLELMSEHVKKQSCLVDYRIFFYKKNGRQNAKTFKLTKFVLSQGDCIALTAKYVFKNMTTRKHYPGAHAWQLLINGEPAQRFDFELV